MDGPFLLSQAPMRRIELFSPRSYGMPTGDDRRIASGIVDVIKHGLLWRDASHQQWEQVPAGCRETFTTLADMMDSSRENVLAYIAFTKGQWA